MNRESSSCPDPEVLAAFAAGNLSGAELEMTVEHLCGCGDCREIVAEAIRFESLSKPLVAPRRRSRLPVWGLAAAATLAGVGYVSVAMIRASRANAPMRALVAAAPADGRYLEPRVSGGFPWAPLRPTQRGAKSPDPSQMKLVGAAGRVIEQTDKDNSAAARHASAVARLLTGSLADAASQLARLAEASPSAEVWNDLAAASYAEAVQTDDPPKLAQALAAADAALRVNPRLPEALFNRALILEHLGMRDQARDAWRTYLSVDRATAWAREAESHVGSLSGVSDFRLELDRAYTASGGEDLADRFPQEARVWGESEILNRWARREIAGNSSDAAVHLRLAETFGDELFRRRGESMLRDAVATIQHADPADRKLLAEAHIEFREAQSAYKKVGPNAAEASFRNAAVKFELGGSPMSLVARYFAANTAYDQGRINEARAQLEAIESELRPEYKAQAAQVAWELGITYAALGHWGQALDCLGRSIEGFELLGERDYAMTVREILAEAYDRIGESRKAWNHRIVALQRIGRSDDLRLQVAIYAIARGATLNHDWPVALSFVNLQFDMGRHPGDELMYAHILLLRASIQGRMGRQRAAADDLARAAAAIAAIPDSTQRERAESERFAVEGFLAASPSKVIELVSRAIEFQRTKGRRMFLPELLLHRGRAFAATGKQAQAGRDFEVGIRELEEQRTSITPGDERWGMFGAAEELFDEAVVLALQRGDSAGALAYSERARARELLDSMGLTFPVVAPGSLPDAVILEYVQLREKMIIFVVDGDRIRVVQHDIESAEVAREAGLLMRGATTGDPAEFRRIASLLYDQLLGPVADELASDSTLIVVPDGSLALVPFAALIDPAGRYVVERRAVVIAPSIAALTRKPKETIGRRPRLLMVAGPSSREGDLGSLTSEHREIDSVAAEYGSNVDYAPKAGLADVLEHRAAEANVIHFVGHAVMSDADNEGALVTSRHPAAEAQLDVREIAAMHLRNINVVILAACGTARGLGRVGTPSVSVARAFLTAGVRSAVATLWPIEDGPAAEFFTRFHHYLVQGLPPPEALRAVQLEWINRRDGSPGVWAAVQIIGT